MELLDLLERRVGDLLQNNQNLREENVRLRASAEIIAQMREENRLLTEALDREKTLRSEIDRRIDRLLAGIGEHERACAPPDDLPPDMIGNGMIGNNMTGQDMIGADSAG